MPMLAGPVHPGEAEAIYWQAGRLADRVAVEWRSPEVMRGRPRGVGTWTMLVGDEVDATLLLSDPDVKTVHLAFAPVAPPEDLDPPTPDFRDDEHWARNEAFGFDAARAWPGGSGAGVQVADVEYSWGVGHEDLPTGVSTWGEMYPDYSSHGTSVLGLLGGVVNGYGIDGGAPGVSLLVYHPFPEVGEYDVAAAIVAATADLGPGDVLLVEQQGYVDGAYCPVSVDPAVREAIVAAVAAGIVVVEPAGNSASNLDDAAWEGAFSRAEDSGSVMVAGVYDDGRWAGSSYGARVDLAAWYADIVTTASGEDDGLHADLFYPEDGRQGYTETFGGTSGASALVAAMAAVIQGVAMETRGAPLDPLEVRAMLVNTARAEPSQPARTGGLPDLRRVLRTYLVP